MKIELPWPPTETHPNSRKHWAVKMRVVKNYRHQCYMAARSYRIDPAYEGDFEIKLVFRPKVNRKRDVDNLIAQVKAGLDGLADALQIDDSRFKTLTGTIGETHKPGIVEVTLEPVQK